MREDIDPQAVEIRLVTPEDCCCEPRFTRTHSEPGHRCCDHSLECKFGRITNSAADPRHPERWPIAHLMLCTGGDVQEMLDSGERRRHKMGGWEWVTSEPIRIAADLDGPAVSHFAGRRLFWHLATDEPPWSDMEPMQHGRWTWELFGAYFVNKRGEVRGPNHLMIGRWPD